MNILINVVDYILEGGIVLVYVECDFEIFYFFVKDMGNGFLEMGLKKVIEFFYMDDKSCYFKGYYGMGLIFVKNVVNFYNGEFIFGNIIVGGVEV